MARNPAAPVIEILRILKGVVVGSLALIRGIFALIGWIFADVVRLAMVTLIAAAMIWWSMATEEALVRSVVDAVPGLAWLVAAISLFVVARFAASVWRRRRILAAKRTKEAIRSLGWEEFEELIEAHYRRLGFRARREGGEGPDGGVDVRISKPGGETSWCNASSGGASGSGSRSSGSCSESSLRRARRGALSSRPGRSRVMRKSSRDGWRWN